MKSARIISLLLSAVLLIAFICSVTAFAGSADMTDITVNSGDGSFIVGIFEFIKEHIINLIAMIKFYLAVIPPYIGY